MKFHRSLAPLLLALAVLAGCGGQTAAPQPTPATAGATAAVATAAADATAPAASPSAAPTSAETPSPAPTATPGISTIGTGPVKIVWWHISTLAPDRANWENLANTYTKAHPEVSIEITVLENEAFKTKLATAMQSGNPPDIFHTWGGGVLKQYAEAGLVQDLSPALAQQSWGASFLPGPLSAYSFDGKTYGAPWSVGMIGIWYNKTLFQQAGIEQPPATWGEFLDTVKKLKAAGITPIALGEKEKWPGHFFWVYLAIRLGGKDAFEKAYSRQGSFADKPFVDAGARLKELIDLEPFQSGYLGSSYNDQQVMMANGKAAMELMGQWAPGNNRGVAEDVNAYNASLGFFPFPMVEGGAGDPSDVLGGGGGFALGKNAPKEAIDFVRFLTNAENQTAMAKAGLAAPPAVKGAEAGLTDPLLKEVQRRTEQAKYFQLYYDQYLPSAVGAVVNDSVQELFAGTMSAEQVAKAIEESAAAELAR